MAEAGSPRKSEYSLSISSSMNSGLTVPARFIVCSTRPGQGADVGTAMPADLGLVADAAERNPHKLAAERLARSNVPGRSCPSRADPQTQDRLPLLLRLQRPNGDVLQDAFLGLLETVVIAFQDLAACRTSRLSGVAAVHGRSRIHSM